MASRSSPPPSSLGLLPPPTLSLSGWLAATLATVAGGSVIVASDGSGIRPGGRGEDNRTPPEVGQALPMALRLSRNPQDLAYLYRPRWPTWPTRSDTAQPSRSDLSQDLAARWNTSPQSEIHAQTHAQPLPDGQLLLRPTAIALEIWLRAFVYHCPPPPVPTAAVEVPFPHKQAPLAEALHLSPLALLQYTHMRCHQLAHRCQGLPPRPPAAGSENHKDHKNCKNRTSEDMTLAVLGPQDLALWRAVVALVDYLADYGGIPPLAILNSERLNTEIPDSEIPDPDLPQSMPLVLPPPILSQGLLKGYHLSVAVDRWLQAPWGCDSSPVTALLLQGITHALAHLLQGWLQVPAPTSL